MDKYLVIITTVLVITQIIRVTQNAINLHRQKIAFEKDLKSLSDLDVKVEDFEMQRKAYRLIVERLGEDNGKNC